MRYFKRIVILFFLILLYFDCTTRSESNTIDKQARIPHDLSLPSGYYLLSEAVSDTDQDGEEEVILFGHKGDLVLLIVFDKIKDGSWKQHVLINTRVRRLSEVELRQLICVANQNWIGWGPPYSEPYQIFVWDGDKYSEPSLLM